MNTEQFKLDIEACVSILKILDLNWNFNKNIKSNYIVKLDCLMLAISYIQNSGLSKKEMVICINKYMIENKINLPDFVNKSFRKSYYVNLSKEILELYKRQSPNEQIYDRWLNITKYLDECLNL